MLKVLYAVLGNLIKQKTQLIRVYIEVNPSARNQVCQPAALYLGIRPVG